MWHDNETDKDLLGFNVHSELLKDIVIDEKMLPISIGLFGDWGSGKSSIMKMLENKLREQKKVVVITFNGWVFEGYDDAKSALVESILKSIVKEKKISARGVDAAKELLKKVDWLRLGKMAVTNVGMPIAKAYATGGLSLIGDGLSKFADLFDNPDQLMEKLKSEEGKKLQGELNGIIKSNKESKNKTPKVVRDFRKEFEKTIDKCEIDSLVIMVDDLDRCTPDRIIDNLEAIKLFLNVKKTAFIIGADKRIVKHAIQYRYKAKDLRDSENGEYENLVNDYLEKLIQVPYILPKLSEMEVETYLTLLLCQDELSDRFEEIVEAFAVFREKDKYSTFGYQNVKDIVGESIPLNQLSIIPTLAPLIAEGLKGNPRQIKRFLNAFTIRKKLANAAKIKEFRDDILIKLMILEYMDDPHFQELFNLQSSENGFPTLIKKAEENLEEIEATLEEFSSWKKSNLIKWFRMEPQLKGEDLRDYFWLSRDKLSASLQSVNLVPPIVKAIYKDLIELQSERKIYSKIKNIGSDLNSTDYIDKLVDLTCKAIIKTPKEKRGHIIMCAFIEEKSQYIHEYQKALESIPVFNNIPASVGNMLHSIEAKGIKIAGIISEINKHKDTKVFKAYNLKSNPKK
ncbi:NTPase [Prolixibacteraceae bacterium JC049]|nr:NTPase [Prolixibacteraceae bacterium JC049]